MCKDQVDDDDSFTEMETSKGICSTPAKIVLFIINLIIWIGSGILLGLGIYGLIGSSKTSQVTDSNMLIGVASVFVIVGGIGFIISFIGCCGAATNGKCFIMTYVVVLTILVLIIIAVAIASFVLRDRLQDAFRRTMQQSMEQYDKNNVNSAYTKAWDELQKWLQCCGTIRYQDWRSSNSGFRSGEEVPRSCCKLDNNGAAQGGCPNTVSPLYAYTEGCNNVLISFLEAQMPIAGGIAAAVALVMILGVILGIVVYRSV